MDTYNFFMDICLFLCGIKGIQLQKETLRLGYPPEKTLLCPRSFSIKGHSRSRKYCQEVCPKLLILSLILIICSFANILAELVFSNYSQLIISVSIPLLLLAIIWFGLSLSKAQKKHFDL